MPDYTGLKAKLAGEPWLPSILAIMIQLPFMSDRDCYVELVLTLGVLRRLPNDGSCGSLTEKEAQFLARYESYIVNP